MGLLIIPIMFGAMSMRILAGVLGPFGEALKKVPMDLDLVQFAAGVGALGIAGIGLALGSVGFVLMAGALSLFAISLLLLVPLMPVLEKLSQLGILGGAELTGGAAAEEGGGGDTENKIVEKLDELIALISKGGKVEMDGSEVGRIINLASGPIGS